MARLCSVCGYWIGSWPVPLKHLDIMLRKSRLQAIIQLYRVQVIQVKDNKDAGHPEYGKLKAT